MKSTTLKLVIASMIVFIFLGCSNDIEDENPEINVDPEVASQLIEDLYAKMYTPGSGGTIQQDDFGHKTYDLFSDLLISDMAISSLSFHSGGLAPYIPNYIATTDFTRRHNQQVWTHYYSIIETANTIIEMIGGENVDPENEADRHFLGQALAMRAHSYFYLTQYMANDYNPAAEILPIYRVPNSDYEPKSTTVEVFQLIENNLNRAINLLENYQRPSKKHINQFMAQAILAYTIAAQRDASRLNEVVELCDAVIDNSGAIALNATEVVGGFNTVETSGWIWGVDLTPEIGLGLISWWGQVDIFSYSYAWVGDIKSIDQNLYNYISINDARRAQFSDDYGINNLVPSNKFYDVSRTVGGTSEMVIADYVYMRIAEMHMLKAESLAKLGQDTAARIALAEVLSERLPDVNYLNSLSGAALEDEIYLQTRIEFWGEGKTYLALKRNERSTGIRGENHFLSDFIGASFAHDDERLTFEIPQSVIDNNPFINNQN